MTLREVFNGVPEDHRSTWLFLPGPRSHWTLDTEAFLIDLDAVDHDRETDEPILPTGLAEKDLRETLSIDLIGDCIKWADGLVGTPDDNIRLESFLYY